MKNFVRSSCAPVIGVFFFLTLAGPLRPAAVLDLPNVILIPPSFEVGQTFTLYLGVTNTGDETANAAHPDSLIVGGNSGGVSLSGPNPNHVTLVAGASQVFMFTGTAAAGVGAGPWSLGLIARIVATDAGSSSTVQSALISSNVVTLSIASTKTITPTMTSIPSATSTDSPTATFQPSPSPSITPSFSASPTAEPAAPFCGADIYSPYGGEAFFNVALKADGSVLMLGHSAPPASSTDVLLRAYDAAGATLSSRTYSLQAGTYESGRALAVDAAGRAYIALWSSPLGKVLALDAAGDTRWSKTLGYFFADSLALSDDGKVAAIASQDSNNIDIRVFDADGNSLWARTETSVNTGFNFNSTFDACGRLWVPLSNGRLLGYDGGAGIAAELALGFGARDIAVDPAGRLVVAGYDGQTRVRKLGSDGSIDWTASLSGLQPWGVAVDREGAVYVCGDSGIGTGLVGTETMFVAKYSAAGSHQWTWIGQQGRAESLQVDDSGTVWIAAWDNTGHARAIRLCPGPLGPAQPALGCLSPTPTQSPSPTRTPSATRTATPAPALTATATATASPSPSASPSPAATAILSGADPSVVGLRLVPHPYSRWLYVRLDQAAERVEMSLHSTNRIQVLRWQAGPLGEGWNRLDLPPAFAALPAGSYELSARALGSAGTWSKAVWRPLVRLR